MRYLLCLLLVVSTACAEKSSGVPELVPPNIPKNVEKVKLYSFVLMGEYVNKRTKTILDEMTKLKASKKYPAITPFFVDLELWPHIKARLPDTPSIVVYFNGKPLGIISNLTIKNLNRGYKYLQKNIHKVKD